MLRIIPHPESEIGKLKLRIVREMLPYDYEAKYNNKGKIMITKKTSIKKTFSCQKCGAKFTEQPTGSFVKQSLPDCPECGSKSVILDTSTD